MKNIDKDIEDIKIEKILLDEPSFTGEGYDITEPLDIEDLLVPIKQDPDTGDASIAERIAAEQRAAKLKEDPKANVYELDKTILNIETGIEREKEDFDFGVPK